MNSTTVSLRSFKGNDLQKILEIAVAAWQPVYRFRRDTLDAELYASLYTNWEDRKREQVQQACEGKHNARVLIAELAGEVVGFVSYYSDNRTGVGEIGNNAVHPHYQKRGIATNMYYAAMQDLRESGMSYVKVETGGDPAHAPAYRAYRKVGFETELPGVKLFKKLAGDSGHVSGDFSGIRSVHYIADDPGLTWLKDPEVSISPDSPLDSLSILTPNVVRLPQGGFRIYYTGLGPERPVESSQGYILSAVSTDGLIWQKEPGIRLDVHEPDASRRVLCPDVIPLPDGRWRMYFEARSSEGPSVILSAISTDGLEWDRESGVRVADPEWSFGSPRCIYVEDPESPTGLGYRLYFHHYSYPMQSGLGAQNYIISAISSDGLQFEIEPGIRVPQEDAKRESYAVYAPEVIRLADASYRIYYSGWSDEIRGGIFSASSRDGLNWIKDVGPLLDLDRPLDCRMVSEPCVISLDDGRCRLYYEAEGQDKRRCILSATSGE